MIEYIYLIVPEHAEQTILFIFKIYSYCSFSFKVELYLAQARIVTDIISETIQVFVRSTDMDRTLMSAYCVLAGLYPSPTPTQAWNNTWQPIPVHTLPLLQDYVGQAASKQQSYYQVFCVCLILITEFKNAGLSWPFCKLY